MALTQRFQILETVPGLPGERVCYGCKAPDTMPEDTGGEPAAVLTMAHEDDCTEIRRLAAG